MTHNRQAQGGWAAAASTATTAAGCGTVHVVLATHVKLTHTSKADSVAHPDAANRTCRGRVSVRM